MASTRFFFVIFTIAAIFIPSIFATDYVVGDDQGWMLDFDYQAWTQGKEFRVGDKLIFRYRQGAHNVLGVDGQSFRQCRNLANVQPLVSGNDEITLSTPGRKWYICGIGNHCESRNMKFLITVLPQLSPADGPSSPSGNVPQPPPQESAATGSSLSTYYAFMAVVIGFVLMAMV